MKCETYYEDLQAFLDGELAPSERERVADHVAACPACRSTLRDLRSVSGALAKWPVPEPAGLPSARELLARHSATRSPAGAQAWPSIVPSRWLATAALVVIAAGFALVVFRSRMLPSPATSPPSVLVLTEEGPGGEEPAPGPTLGPAPSDGSSANRTAKAIDNTPAEQAREEARKMGADEAEAVTATDANDARTPGASMGGTAAPPAPPAAQTTASAPENEFKEADRQEVGSEVERADAPAPMIAGESSAGAGVRDSEVTAQAERSRPVPPASRPLSAGRQRAAAQAIVKRGSLRLKTGDPAAAAARIVQAVEAAGGGVESRSANRTDKDSQTIRLRLRVDPNKLESTLARIKSLGTVLADSSTTTDVSDQLEALDRQVEEDGADASSDDSGRQTAKSRPSRAKRARGAPARARAQLADEVRRATIDVVVEGT